VNLCGGGKSPDQCTSVDDAQISRSVQGLLVAIPPLVLATCAEITLAVANTGVILLCS
jgi:hypothetical protein